MGEQTIVEVTQVTEEDILEMVRRIVAAANPVKVILFGSRARGTARLDSDVDLLVIEHEPVAQRQESVRLRSLLRDFQVPIDIVVMGQSFAERYWDAHRYAQPLERVGEPEDIARCAVFLASDDARFITGQNIVVDGGATSKIPYRGQGQPSEKIFTTLEEMRSWMGRHARRDR